MDISILTLFPGMFAGPLDQSILGRACERGIVSISLHNIRDHAHDRHHVVDDSPFGGGPGMVMKPEPLFLAAEAVKTDLAARRGQAVADAAPFILLSPQGRPFTQALAQELAEHPALVFICGRYEGIDARAEDALATDVISIGDYVLTGGEIPAMAIIDAVVRLLPGVLGDDTSAIDESFSEGLLEGPQRTRARRSTGAWPCPTSSSPATTRPSRGGVGGRRCSARTFAARTCSRARTSRMRTAPTCGRSRGASRPPNPSGAGQPAFSHSRFPAFGRTRDAPA